MRRLAVVGVGLMVFTGCSSGNGFPALGNASSTSTQPSPSAPLQSIRPGTGNAFCEFLRTYNERFSQFNAGLAEAGQLQRVMTDAAVAIRDAENTAPAEVRADLTTMRLAFEELIRALDQVGFDLARLRLETLTIIQTPNFLQASQRVETYTRDHCL